ERGRLPATRGKAASHWGLCSSCRVALPPLIACRRREFGRSTSTGVPEDSRRACKYLPVFHGHSAERRIFARVLTEPSLVILRMYIHALLSERPLSFT